MDSKLSPELGEIPGKTKAQHYPSSIEAGVCENVLKCDEDDAVLRANGHEAAMPHQFTWLSALGLSFSIINSWIGYLVCPIRQCRQVEVGLILIFFSMSRAALART